MKKIEDLEQVDREEIERLIGIVCKDDIIGQRLARVYPASFLGPLVEMLRMEGYDVEMFESLLERIK